MQHDGLFNHFTTRRQGKGAIKLISADTQIALQANFGRLLKVPFTMDYPLGQCRESSWKTEHAYSKPGEEVSYKGIIYQARHWSYNFEPDKSGPWDTWQAVSYCDGTVL